MLNLNYLKIYSHFKHLPSVEPAGRTAGGNEGGRGQAAQLADENTHGEHQVADEREVNYKPSLAQPAGSMWLFICYIKQ